MAANKSKKRQLLRNNEYYDTEPNTIRKYLDKLKDVKLNFAKLNKFRSLVGNCKIEYR